MIQSMTGFGKSEVNVANKKITLQLKSLNSKKLDLYARVPSAYREQELILHKMIADKLQRGKIDFSLSVENVGEHASTSINQAVVKGYVAELKALATGQGSELDYLKMAIGLPEALHTERKEIDKAEFKAIEKGLAEALTNIDQYRTDEGKSLEADFKLRLQNITNLLDEVERIDPERIQTTRERLETAVSELKEAVDQNRFEQELIYYIEKYDINEEKTRLRNHLAYFAETMALAESNGRKLGFIAQEMGREINTIGSKSNYATMQKCVVQMKDELEKIKEQILNVL